MIWTALWNTFACIGIAVTIIVVALALIWWVDRP